jgi:RNA polymerase sigma factor (sigma-70 family)
LLKRVEAEGGCLYQDEYELALRWQYFADGQALDTLLRRFKWFVARIASERYRTCQADKGTFEDLFAAGLLELVEAANQYDGRCRFSTYAYWKVFKRCQEFIRLNWNVVTQPEPPEWKVRKEDKTPNTIPNPGLNPFENPYSIDCKSKRPRHSSYSSPSGDEDDYRALEELVTGRFGAGSVDVENDIDGANHFESAAYDSAAAEARALEVETLALTLDARTLALLPRELQVIRARFPWAIDVQNAPHREEELRQYQRGHHRYYPKEHTLETIGVALGITGEGVRRIEKRALEKIGASKLVGLCSSEMFWGPEPAWNEACLEGLATNWKAPNLPSPVPVSDEPCIDELARLMCLVLRQYKHWMARSINCEIFNPLLYEQEIRQGKLLPIHEKQKYLSSEASKYDLKLHRIKLNDGRLPFAEGEEPTGRFEVEDSYREWGELLPILTTNPAAAELLVEKAEQPTPADRYFPGHLRSAISGAALGRSARPVQPWILKLKGLLSPKQPTPNAYEFVAYRFEWPYSWLPKDERRKFQKLRPLEYFLSDPARAPGERARPYEPPIIVGKGKEGEPITWTNSQTKHPLIGDWERVQATGWVWIDGKWTQTGNKKIKNEQRHVLLIDKPWKRLSVVKAPRIKSPEACGEPIRHQVLIAIERIDAKRRVIIPTVSTYCLIDSRGPAFRVHPSDGNTYLPKTNLTLRNKRRYGATYLNLANYNPIRRVVTSTKTDERLIYHPPLIKNWCEYVTYENDVCTGMRLAVAFLFLSRIFL